MKINVYGIVRHYVTVKHGRSEKRELDAMYLKRGTLDDLPADFFTDGKLNVRGMTALDSSGLLHLPQFEKELGDGFRIDTVVDKGKIKFPSNDDSSEE